MPSSDFSDALHSFLCRSVNNKCSKFIEPKETTLYVHGVEPTFYGWGVEPTFNMRGVEGRFLHTLYDGLSLQDVHTLHLRRPANVHQPLLHWVFSAFSKPVGHTKISGQNLFPFYYKNYVWKYIHIQYIAFSSFINRKMFSF